MGVLNQAEIDAAGVTAPDPVARRAFRERLRAMFNRGEREYPFPDLVPVVGDVAQRVDATTYNMGAIFAVGARVYIVDGFTTASVASGTSGTGTAPTTTGIAITDGQIVVSCIGYLGDAPYAASTAYYATQNVVAGGRVYPVLVGGTTASGGTAPTHLSGTATDGGVTFGPPTAQTSALVTLDAAAPSGTTLQVAWNSPNVTVLGGTLIQNGANARGGLASRSFDGQPYTEANSDGGGSIYTMSDAPVKAFTFTNTGGFYAWVDDRIIFVTRTAAAAQRYLTFNHTGTPAPRKMRRYRFLVPFTIKFAGFFGSASDTFMPFVPADPMRVVAITDSFGASTSNIPFATRYASKLLVSMGVEDVRVSPLGGSGILQRNGSSANYVERFTQDMISQNPELVIIQCSGNDAQGIGTAYTVTDVGAAITGLINRVKNELPNSRIIVMGLWNNRGTLPEPSLSLNGMASTVAAATGVPFVEWSNFLLDGGYIGHTDGSGRNSGFYTGDGTHRTWWGDDYTARRLKGLFRNAVASF